MIEEMAEADVQALIGIVGRLAPEARLAFTVALMLTQEAAQRGKPENNPVAITCPRVAYSLLQESMIDLWREVRQGDPDDVDGFLDELTGLLTVGLRCITQLAKKEAADGNDEGWEGWDGFEG